MILLTILEVGCVGAPERPDVDLCTVNFATDKPAHLHCQNILHDYDDSGNKLPGHPAHDIDITSPQMLNAGKYVSPSDWTKVEKWILDMRAWASSHCQATEGQK